jgi:hypothetical protein
VNRGLLVASLVCALFLCSGAAAGAVSGTPFPQENVDPDDILLSIEVEEDGDAVWTIEYRTRLETDEDEAAFEDLRADIEADPAPYAERFEDRMNRTAGSAENSTGREMEIEAMNVSVERLDLPREYGVLTYRFRWTNFAATDGDRLLVGDAIDGLFLEDGTTLVISWSGEYELLDASPEPTDTQASSVVYNGPVDFTGGEPRIELGPPGTAPSTEADGSLPISPLAAAALALLLLAAVGGGIAVYRRRDLGRMIGADSSETRSADEPNEEDEDAGDEGGAVAASPDPELLSNEEQVLQLIEAEGGRMKQKEVAERLEWTDAKTSQVTKKLRESGELEGFRLGRENVLSLPDEESGAE